MEFEAWPKTPRLYRDVVITEKIDGTNAAVIVEPYLPDGRDERASLVEIAAGVFNVGAQSRNRLITPDADNYGFATWVRDNASQLATLLGPGRHFGEWWGAGIQRGYGLTNGDKRFSLFNVGRYAALDSALVAVVPVIYEGVFSAAAVDLALADLSQCGSRAARGFDRPEGICVFHVAARQVFKVLLENDDLPKSVAA